LHKLLELPDVLLWLPLHGHLAQEVPDAVGHPRATALPEHALAEALSKIRDTPSELPNGLPEA
jgi:hypothetical protein